MNLQKAPHDPLVILRTTINTIIANPIIVAPLVIFIFLQVLVLEILYFAPRYPLSAFFGPIITRLWSENFLHFPYNFILLPKLFYYTQVFLYITLGAYLTAMSIRLIASVNNEESVSLKKAFRQCASSYVHIVLYAILSFVFYFTFMKGYELIIQRAMQIRSTQGPFFLLKKTVLLGEPYFQFLFGIIITALFVFVIPLIVLEKKKIFSAILNNFRWAFKAPWMVLLIVILPSLFYLPIIVLRSNVIAISDYTTPEIQVAILVLSIVISVLVEGIISTAITLHYLLKRENS